MTAIYKMTKDEWKTFKNRNINQYILNKLCGIHFLKKRKYNKLVYNFLKLKYIFEYEILNKINIPQIEFAITTHCTLRCKHCTNYIPYVEKDKHCIITFEQFKIYLDNLLKNANRLNSIILLGGEPLLNRDLHKMVQYSIKNKKIENVYIVTNGTLDFSEELKKIIEKKNKKLYIWISDYTANKQLEKKIHVYPLLKMNFLFVLVQVFFL